jgi:uncharacterized protein (DUF1697 family)
MQKYLALLRGINVSGQKLIKMTDLKSHFEELGFNNVLTYIQSGNIVFEANKTDDVYIAKEISHKIKEKYGWDVPVMVRTDSDLRLMIENSPFLKQGLNSENIYITFLENAPLSELVKKFNEIPFGTDLIVIHQRHIYSYIPGGYGKTKHNNNFIESKLKVSATTRNLKTVLKLMELLTF